MSRGEFFVKIRGFREDFLGEIVLFDLVGSPRSVFEKLDFRKLDFGLFEAHSSFETRFCAVSKRFVAF